MFKTIRRLKWLWVLVVFAYGGGFTLRADGPLMPSEEEGAATAPTDPAAPSSDLEYRAPLTRSEPNLWAVEFGAALISDNVPSDILNGRFHRAKGDAAGWIYNLTMAYTLHEFEWKVGRFAFHPRAELAGTLTLVNERKQDLFPDYNIAPAIRWTDFPWNRYLRTTFAIGGGLSYSSKIWTIDRVRHPGEDRSHWKFHMPMQFTFALPRHDQHQLMFFTDHMSGGHIFDQGGVDSWGLGYRFEF